MPTTFHKYSFWVDQSFNSQGRSSHPKLQGGWERLSSHGRNFLMAKSLKVMRNSPVTPQVTESKFWIDWPIDLINGNIFGNYRKQMCTWDTFLLVSYKAPRLHWLDFTMVIYVSFFYESILLVSLTAGLPSFIDNSLGGGSWHYITNMYWSFSVGWNCKFIWVISYYWSSWVLQKTNNSLFIIPKTMQNKF